MKPSYFFENIYTKRAYGVVGSKGKERIEVLVQDFMFDLNLRRLIKNSASEKIHVQFLADKATGQLDSFQVEKEDPKTALLCHKSGGSALYFRSSQQMADAFVTQLNYDLGMNFGGKFYEDNANKGEIEVFVSRKGHATDWLVPKKKKKKKSDWTKASLVCRAPVA